MLLQSVEDIGFIICIGQVGITRDSAAVITPEHEDLF